MRAMPNKTDRDGVRALARTPSAAGARPAGPRPEMVIPACLGHAGGETARHDPRPDRRGREARGHSASHVARRQ